MPKRFKTFTENVYTKEYIVRTPPHRLPPNLPTHPKSCNRFNLHENCPKGGRDKSVVRQKSISSYYWRMYFTLLQTRAAFSLNSAKCP